MGIEKIASRLSLGWDIYQFWVWLIGTAGTSGGALLIWRELESASLLTQIFLGIGVVALWALIVTVLGSRLRRLLSEPSSRIETPQTTAVQSSSQLGGQTAYNIVNYGRNPSELRTIAEQISKRIESGGEIFNAGKVVSAENAEQWVGRFQQWTVETAAEVMGLLGTPAATILKDFTSMLPFSFRSDLGEQFNSKLQSLDRLLHNYPVCLR